MSTYFVVYLYKMPRFNGNNGKDIILTTKLVDIYLRGRAALICRNLLDLMGILGLD